MNEDFGGDIITISDEDGNEFDLELLDTIEFSTPWTTMTSWIVCTNTTSRSWKRKKRRNKIFFLRCS